MEEPRLNFIVTVEPHLPEFDAERLFVINERKYAEQEIQRLERSHGALNVARGLIGSPKPKDWKHYLHALNHYWDRLEEHRQDIAGGLVPLKFFVANNGTQKDSRIKIRVNVENGSVHPAKEAPRRPKRIDGPQHNDRPMGSTVPMILSGFSRSGIKIRPHSIESVFSQLDAGESADVVHDVLYIKGDENTNFTYEVSSKRIPAPERGNVIFME